MTTPVLLYVEDEVNDIFFLRYAIAETGASIALHTASTGPDAIAYLAGTGRYDDRSQHPLPAVVLPAAIIVRLLRVVECVVIDADRREILRVMMTDPGRCGERRSL